MQLRHVNDDDALPVGTSVVSAPCTGHSVGSSSVSNPVAHVGLRPADPHSNFLPVGSGVPSPARIPTAPAQRRPAPIHPPPGADVSSRARPSASRPSSSSPSASPSSLSSSSSSSSSSSTSASVLAPSSSSGTLVSAGGSAFAGPFVGGPGRGVLLAQRSASLDSSSSSLFSSSAFASAPSPSLGLR